MTFSQINEKERDIKEQNHINATDIKSGDISTKQTNFKRIVRKSYEQ